MDVLRKLKKFYKKSKLEKGYIGKTYLGEKIPFFKVEFSPFPKCILTYAIHAREYITTYLALEQIKDFAKNGNVGCVYFIPAINIDGIKIVLKDNPLYKANYRGVDLNVNFDARWGSGAQNVRYKSSQNYIGEYPFSESETKALRDFTLKIKPDVTVSYHSKGEEIYYEFFQSEKDKKRDYALAKSVSEVTGYAIKSTLSSAGGYKDWCIQTLFIPALTIEVGKDSLSHPIKKDSLPEIYQKNKEVVKIITENDIWKKNL